MSINEFVSRFAAKDESSFLFEILRRVGHLDLQAVQDSASGWVEWPPADNPGGSGVGIAHA